VSIKFNFKGIEVTTSSTSEAAVLIRELTEIPQSKPQSSPVYLPSAYVIVDKFLQTIVTAPPEGPSTTQIMEAVGVTDGRGLGGKLLGINNILDKHGLNPNDVYGNPKTADGRRTWFAGPKIQEAIEKMKESAK
jgi:hypothetical protein